MALKERKDIDPKDKWAIEDLFNTDEAWEEEYNRLNKELLKEPPYKGRLKESYKIFNEALEESDRLEWEIERVYVYANQKYYEDTTCGKYQDFAGKAGELMSLFYSKYAYQEPELLEMDEDTFSKYYLKEKNEGIFARYMENIKRQKEHISSGEIEQLLASAQSIGKGPSDIFSSYNNADISFEKAKDSNDNVHEVTHGKYSSLMESEDRELRKNAFKSVYREYTNIRNTLAAMFNANVKQTLFFAKARKYNSSIEAALDYSNIPVKVYDNLIKVVNDNITLMHEYVRVRKECLGLNELHMYDVYAPLVDNVEYKVTFEQAKEIVYKGLAPLGEEYLSILKEGFDNGWIDVYENKGKRSGAFSWGAYGTHPYVFLNFSGNLDSVFTLAHEMGHAIHTYLSNKNQPHIYSGYRIFVAEVASTCNEALLINYLIKTATDDKLKLYLINHLLEQFKGTVFRQTMFAEFEKLTHKMCSDNVTLTAEVLCEQYKNLNEVYFGPDMIIDSEISMEWSRIPHFYNPFYVYQYATGFSAAMAISRKILDGEENAVENYMRFLSGGSSMDPIELLKIAGVDMEKPQVIQSGLDVFKEMLNEFFKLYKKI